MNKWMNEFTNDTLTNNIILELDKQFVSSNEQNKKIWKIQILF